MAVTHDYSNQPIRILLVDDHPVMRTGLANVLAMDPDFTVVAQADDGETALALWRQLRPDVTLLDISMDGIDGIDTLRRLLRESPSARVLILTSSEAGEDVRMAMKAGAWGYVTKSIRSIELADAIRTIHEGERVLSDKVRRALEETDGTRHLSSREIEVLGLVRQGFTNDETSRLLGISERTVRAHMTAILEKLQVSDRASAVARGFETGLLKA